MSELLHLFKTIKTFVFDIDGVLTDGSLLVFDNGQLFRKMHVKDGYALQLAVKMGYQVVVISGAVSEPVRIRLAGLGITNVHLGIHDKRSCLQETLQKSGTSRETTLFMGDDIPDWEVMKWVGLPCCPSDAVPEIKEIATYISPLKGGEGCVRDVVEKVLKLNNQWPLHTRIASRSFPQKYCIHYL